MTSGQATPVPAAQTAVSAPSRTLQISELYASLQGESTWTGRPCSFIRLTGCPLRCVWCDSSFAFRGGERMTFDAILDQIRHLGWPLVEVTGGEPLAQPGCLDLLQTLCDAGYEVLLETSGACDVAAVDPRVIKIVDVKCPGSGEVAANHWANLAILNPADEVKFVLASRADYEWARDVVREHGLGGARVTHFSPAWDRIDPAELAQWILEDRLDVRLQLQLHKRLWPGRDQGI